MPLAQGRSPQAFSQNVSTEMHAGKPQNQALAIAYAVKRKNAKKMSAGGMAEPSEKELYSGLHHYEPHELAHAIIQKLAFGGEAYSSHEDDELSDTEDMFSDESDGELDGMFDGGYAEGGDVNPKLEAAHEVDPRKNKIKDLMARIRMRCMGGSV